MTSWSTSKPAQATQVELFRPEVLAAQRTQWLGTVLLAPRLSHRLFALGGVLAAVAIAALFFFGGYTRTARVSGWLVPTEGVARVVAPQAGVVTALHVAEGARVRAGERLVTLSGELQSAALGPTQAEVTRQLAERSRSLAAERDYELAHMPGDGRALAKTVALLKSQEVKLAGEIELQKARLVIAEQAEALWRRMQKQGYIAEPRFQQVQAETLDQRARLSTLERARLALVRQLEESEHELRDLPGVVKKQTANLERTMAQVEQEHAQAEAKREIELPAPYDGTVTAIVALPGMHAGVGTALLSIVPSNATLEAHLYSPSRAIGFVHPGQRVLVRYQAYPYQKFGHYEGEVTSVSRSPVAAGELPPQLPQAAAAAGSTPAPGEPLYRIAVALKRQTVSAYGHDTRLQPGMLLEGDVALDRRRLYEWVLEPLYTLTGKFKNE